MLTPGAPGRNLARSLRDPDRRAALAALADAAMAGADPGLGLVLRTAAGDADGPEIEADIAALRAEWTEISEADGPPRLLRPAPGAAERGAARVAAAGRRPARGADGARRGGDLGGGRGPRAAPGAARPGLDDRRAHPGAGRRRRQHRRRPVAGRRPQGQPRRRCRAAAPAQAARARRSGHDRLRAARPRRAAARRAGAGRGRSPTTASRPPSPAGRRSATSSCSASAPAARWPEAISNRSESTGR